MNGGRTVGLTGGRGFIGRTLAATLAGPGLRVTMLEGDVLSRETFSARFDTLIHLAGAVPRHFRDDPGLAVRTNIEGMKNALAACERNGAKMVFASTAGVYDRTLDGPIDENGAISPSSSYAETKLEAEDLLRGSGVRGTTLRLFNPYGRGQGSDMLLGYLIEYLSAGRPVIVRNPDAARDFIHVSDVARAFSAAVMADAPDILNIGTGTAVRVGDAVNAILSRIAAPPPVDWQNEGDESSVVADISLARRSIGWAPRMSFQSGLDEALLDTVVRQSARPLNP